LVKAFQEDVADLLVTLGKFCGDYVQQRPDLVFWERHDPGDNSADPLRISWAEWPQKYARLVGL
jgi:hypothetical protein